jgi:3'-5' exoribonuclease
VNQTDLPNTPPRPADVPPEQLETVVKVYARDLREHQDVHTVFKVTHKAKHTSRAGRTYLTLTLGDKTGSVDGRVFEQPEALEPSFQEGDYVLVHGKVIAWQGKPQLVVDRLERLDPEPVDPAEFAVPQAPPRQAEPDPRKGPDGRAVSHIRELAQRVEDPHVRALLLAFLDDPEIAGLLPMAPAAKGIHHAYKGGLADHILSVMKLAHRIADHYPMADRDLLIAGAMLHDICKVTEISKEGDGFAYTDEGRLVGHIVMTAQKIREKASRIDGFPPALEHHLTHLVISHHGQLDWGSPKVPMTLEALLVHLIDTLDSRVASWLELMERDPNEKWTELSKLYDRHLWKGPLPTTRARGPVEPRRRTRRGKGPKAAEAHGEPAPRERLKERPKGAGRELAFKPLAELSAKVTAAAEEQARSPASPEPAPPPPSAPEPGEHAS